MNDRLIESNSLTINKAGYNVNLVCRDHKIVWHKHLSTRYCRFVYSNDYNLISI